LKRQVYIKHLLIIVNFRLDRVEVAGSIPVQVTIYKSHEAFVYKASFFF
jgi:hypothetical protein